MKERPIIFSDPMVRAILEGRKTQTRRVIKGVPHFWHFNKNIMDWWLSGIYAEDGKFWLDVQTEVDDNTHDEIFCPYGKPGELLWVREKAMLRSIGPYCAFSLTYAADESVRDFAEEYSPYVVARWTPSIHMPRWASRLTLRITEVRVQRVQEVDPEDVIQEGVPYDGNDGITNNGLKRICDLWEEWQILWDSINAKRGYPWESNPWVWAISFERIKP
jgi:hypothetical protein